MATETLDLTKEILDILKYEDINNIKEIIDEEYNNLRKLKIIANPITEFEAYEEWATRVTHYRIRDALSALHSDLTSADPELNILRTIKQDLENTISADAIHTETLTRGMTNYFYSLTLWQALGFSLLFKANDILQGPSANNFQYKLMISRMSDQKAVLREIMETIDDSDNYIVRELNPEPIGCDWLCGLCGHNLNDLKFLHLGGVEADDGKVVTGFKFIQHPNETNRLAISIKQGELKEMGVIGEQDWKEPGEGDSQQFYGSGLDTIHEADWTFHQADPGRTIVGIKFCVDDVRVGFCIKTKKVNFASGQLGSADDWSDAVKKSGDNGLLQWDGEKWKNTDKGFYKLYKNSFTVIAEAEVVEANPPAMLTGVGLFGKEGCNSLKKKHLVIRTNDIFEFDETSLKSCGGEHSDYSKEESDTIGCCGEYMYDSSSQRCIEDEYGVKEPHYISIPDCGDTPTNSENKMECADGEKVEVDVTSEVWEDNWDACFKRQSHIVRCPFPYIPCEDMWERKMDFKCGINCASKGGKRQTCNGGMNTLNLTQVVNKCLFRYEVFC